MDHVLISLQCIISFVLIPQVLLCNICGPIATLKFVDLNKKLLRLLRGLRPNDVDTNRDELMAEKCTRKIKQRDNITGLTAPKELL